MEGRSLPLGRSSFRPSKCVELMAMMLFFDDGDDDGCVMGVETE